MKAKVVPIDAAADLRMRIIDEYGELDALAKRHEELGKLIRGWYADEPAAKTFLAEGAKYALTVSARRNQRRVTNLAKLFGRLKKGTFLDFCGFTLDALKKALPESEHGDYIACEQTGPRQITSVVEKPAKQAA